MPNHFKEEVSMAIVHPTAENFGALIRDNKLVLVDFFQYLEKEKGLINFARN